MTWNTCHRCKTQMWIPDELNTAALHQRGPNGIRFYCAYGHDQYYVEGESDETKLRRERDLLKQQLAFRDDRIKNLDRRLTAQRGVVTRIKNRVGNGVCPCCNRSFHDLLRHMKTKHPDYTAEAAE